ncbi:MAG: sn-glycerol-3-phosphate ABC transporter ATP-binding protein UgpC [Nitrospiraceae bacterium]
MADLELRNLTKRFGEQTILQNISLRVADGSFTILLGPSGCGKSTILRIIAGLEPQTEGQVFIGNRMVDGLSPKDRDIAMVFQHYALYPHLTVRENLSFGLKMRGAPRGVIEPRIEEVAQLLEIHSLLDRKPKDLSGGQRQRVAMGRAIVRQPKLFLFDEPLSNLDAKLRSSMRIELKRLHQRLGATMIYVTHDQVEAMTLGDTIVVMEKGRIRQVDPPARIYHAPADPFVAGFIGTPPMNLLDGSLQHQGSHWTLQTDSMTIPIPLVKGPTPIGRISRVVLGIRPEDLRLDKSGEPATEIEVQVELVEDLGSDLILHLSIGPHRLIMRAQPGRCPAEGTTIPLYLPHDKLHLFIDDRRADWA